MDVMSIFPATYLWILVAETRRHILTTISSIIEALYIVLAREKLSERRPTISMDKLAVYKCSWKNQQLDLFINTCTITVRLHEGKIFRLAATLTITLHTHMKSLTLLEDVTLLDNLEYAASLCP